MLKVSTAKEMQEIDRVTIDKYGMAGVVLMERAGLAVVKRINELFFLSTVNRQPSTVIVLCGAGNNGGDGFVIARLLHERGIDVEVYMTAGPAGLKGDAKANYNAAGKYGVRIFPINKFMAGRGQRTKDNVIIVDALLGTGLSKEVRPPLSVVIRKVNRMPAPVVSVDIPSGISSDTGEVMGCAIKARCTVTFGLPKRGHLLYPGAEHAGRLFVEDIGFPSGLLVSKKIMVNLVRRVDAVSMMPARPRHSHKGTYGHVLLVAGSRGKTGAALMAAKACLRSGAGLVTIGIPGSLVSAFQPRVTEEMILPLPDRGDGTLSYEAAAPILGFMKKKGTVLAIGPGLSADDEIARLVVLLVTGSKAPVVVDADGINAIAARPGILKKCTAPVILTPHQGEMNRLLREPEVPGDRISTAVSFAKRTRTYLVLKGAPTVTAVPDGTAYINSSGNPGMATAGTGDVLTGMISAFLAQGLSARDASVLGVYMHGLAGDIAVERKGMYSLIASDLVREIPNAFKNCRITGTNR
ncbi:MAG: NAD(P)H-hydrate dehydratase [Nitrospirota bacterium]|nr:NAD(P)H-hydrate dehydratase [Nitrospirota bacterium]